MHEMRNFYIKSIYLLENIALQRIDIHGGSTAKTFWIQHNSRSSDTTEVCLGREVIHFYQSRASIICI